VKFLVDNQLPAALARWLAARGLDACHVSDVGLEEASDQCIWDYAVAQGRALVSKDEDFLHLATRSEFSAPLIWVRLGNCRKQALLAAFDTLLLHLLAALAEGKRVVELR
jgi:predicted nuclease of predicted toxin-antitoxin system